MSSNKNHEKKPLIWPEGDSLFHRVASILDQARGNVVRSVNSNMVLAYWLIGREIVLELQGGEDRAEYGRKIVETLSAKLTKRYGKGFSTTNLWDCRQFYQAYAGRPAILHPTGGELADTVILSQTGRESQVVEICHLPGDESTGKAIQYPTGSEFQHGFSPQLSWSHYRALMRVQDENARAFYEQEAIECGWSKTQLERQIQSSCYNRILANRGEAGLVATDRERLQGEPVPPEHILKSPYVLEFLDLPDSTALHESVLEQAIINNLQAFLLELGKGFSFVARQKHIRFDDDDFYVDLVFYNFILKCFLLIDLKIGKLTHRDVGQMDGYVRLFEDRFKVAGDNPTIGLILCSGKSEAVARYSVLSEGRQIFASKYLQFLPSEQDLRLEIEKERQLIETAIEERKEGGAYGQA
ncbi:MAG: DUF1016 domain-containing protein [Nitrospirae bacterium]|nr:DUF1016 domain-containing protein [Nitrospirota bacterium]